MTPPYDIRLRDSINAKEFSRTQSRRDEGSRGELHDLGIRPEGLTRGKRQEFKRVRKHSLLRAAPCAAARRSRPPVFLSAARRSRPSGVPAGPQARKGQRPRGPRPASPRRGLTAGPQLPASQPASQDPAGRRSRGPGPPQSLGRKTET